MNNIRGVKPVIKRLVCRSVYIGLINFKVSNIHPFKDSVRLIARVQLQKGFVVSPLLRQKMVRTSVNVFSKTGSKYEGIHQQEAIPVNYSLRNFLKTPAFLYPEGEGTPSH